MFQHTATGKATLCLISSQQIGKTILYLQSPCHFKFSIAAGSQTRYLRFLGIGSFRKAAVRATAYRVPVLTHQQDDKSLDMLGPALPADPSVFQSIWLQKTSPDF